MAQAIFKTGGKQYRVQEGEVLDVEKLDVEPGSETTFEEVLFVGDGDQVSVGTPLVEGASVTAEVMEQVKGRKVVAFQHKRRKGYTRTTGHRQKLTRLKIKSIKG